MVPSLDVTVAIRAWLRSGQLPLPRSSEQADALLHAADAAGVLGVLAGAVVADPGSWPEPQRERLRTSLLTILGRTLRQLDSGRRVIEDLRQAGIRTLPLKGAALAENVYDSPGERAMLDVDLLVLDGWSRALELLRSGGCIALDVADHAHALRTPDGHTVEIHRTLVSGGDLFAIDPERWWRASQPGRGIIPRIPSAEHLVVSQALHVAFQHGLGVPLRAYLDLRRTLERLRCDVSALREEAARCRALVPVAAATRAAFAVVGGDALGAAALALEKEMTRSTRRWVDGAAEPSSPAAPSFLALLRARYALVPGRRRAWIASSLFPAPSPPGPERARRLLRLLRAGARDLRARLLSALGGSASR